MNLAAYIHTEGYIALAAFSGGSTFLDKLGRDTELDDAQKEEFLEHLGRYDSRSGLDIESYCKDWFLLMKFLGTPYPTGRDHVFFRINDIDRFKTWVDSITGIDTSPTLDVLMSGSLDDRSDAFDALLDTPIKSDILLDLTLLEQYLGGSFPATAFTSSVLGEAKTAPWMEWSSPWPAHEHDLFSTGKIEDLDCRMGLTANRTDDKIVYKHDTTFCDELRRPTVFDAGFYDQFQPGGKTVPLAECNTLDGFDEYIHAPNRFRRIMDLPEFIIK